MKRLLFVLSVLLILVSIQIPAKGSAPMPIDITVNGAYIKTDAAPFIVSGTTYVPVRFVSNALCADEVVWDSIRRVAVIKYDGNIMEFPIDKNYAILNGSHRPIRQGVKLIGDRTFVPVRFIAGAMGAKVDWSGEYLTVIIEKDSIKVPADAVYAKKYQVSDIYWLSRIIEAEASGESFEGKVAVGNVILNRVSDKDYPNSVYDVIFDVKHGVQFEPTLNGAIYNTPSYESIVAAKYALSGINVAGDSLYFFNPAIATSTWIANNRPYNMTIGNHVFYF